MDEDAFNMTIRKYLKKVGVTSQREIEKTVRDALADGRLKGDETLRAEMRLTLAGTDLSIVIDGNISLS